MKSGPPAVLIVSGRRTISQAAPRCADSVEKEHGRGISYLHKFLAVLEEVVGLHGVEDWACRPKIEALQLSGRRS